MPALTNRGRNARRLAHGRLLAALALTILACTPAAAWARGGEPGSIAGTNDAAVPRLSWAACPATSPGEADFLRPYQCATAGVPLSYRDPGGPAIELALGRLPASDPQRRIGTLFWNPGGPGGRGRIPPPFSEELHRRFDIVGFDPRGVGASTALRCFQSNEEAFRLLGSPFPVTGAEEREVSALTREATRRCAESGGPLLEHMSTANVARDLDLLRQAVGDDQLTYLGFSYGTHLGAVYANLFPDRVRALTLDAVIDPVEWTTGRTPRDAGAPSTFRLGSHRGSYEALQTFLRECSHDERCPFREPGRDLLGKYDTMLQRVRAQPVQLPGPDGAPMPVIYQDVVGLTLAGVSDPNFAAELASALQALYLATEARPGAATRRLGGDAWRLLSRRGHRFAPPSPAEPYFGLEWGRAVFCTDSDNPSDPEVWPFFARAADRIAPYFGSGWVWLSLPCATWPASDRDRYTGPWDRRTDHDILLVANRLGDPATPYEGAVATARELANARLLTLDSYGHLAFPQSRCIVAKVERYLIDLELPAPGTVCGPDRRPFDPLPAPPPGARQLRQALGLPLLG